nr:ORF6N domain-containing protein [uncultured Marvinbryantia sp.]
MQNLKVMEVHGFRVLTTRQLATMYGTKPEIINNNFTRNKDKYVLEKHYIAVSGEEMRSLRTSHQFDGELKRVSRVYFWTEKGALLHAKSLNTDKAWEVYDYLVDFYFRAKEKQPEIEKDAVVPVKTTTEPVKSSPVIPHIENPIFVFKNLMALAEEENIKLEVKDIKGYFSVLHKDRIALQRNLVLEKAIYETAYELAHYFIHYDCGNLIDSPLKKDYNAQAEKAAYLIIRLLDNKKQISFR